MCPRKPIAIWAYQYSAEHNACARKSASDAAKPVEYSHRIDMDTVAKMRDDSPVQAVWPDGVCRPVPGLTVGELKAVHGSRCTNAVQSPGDIWEGTKIDTKHKIVVKQRTDRQLLVCIYEQSRQILQVRADYFAPLDAQTMLENNHPAVCGAAEVLVPIAQAYCSLEIAKLDLRRSAPSVSRLRVGRSQ